MFAISRAVKAAAACAVVLAAGLSVASLAGEAAIIRFFRDHGYRLLKL